MTNEEIKNILMISLQLQEAYVISEDGSHFQVIAVSQQFDGMSRLKKQQTVYAPLMQSIANNQIHALSIKTYTPVEWQRERKLIGL